VDKFTASPFTHLHHLYSVVVVSGDGIAVNSTSGHLKIGELIGKTARETVIEALIKQNGFYNIPG